MTFQETDIIYMQTHIKVDSENAYIAFQLSRLPDYERGNRSWLVLDQDSETWKKGPGRDYIDFARTAGTEAGEEVEYTTVALLRSEHFEG